MEFAIAPMEAAMSWRLASLPTALLLFGFINFATAGDTSDQKLGIPVYDPASKRYFMFMQSEGNGTWDVVNQQARGRWYKDVQGRLAKVDSLEVHEFLLRNFPLKYFETPWIGLRYLCNDRKLVWSDGTPYQRDGFQVWDKNWKADVYFCKNAEAVDWAPVAYTPQFTWMAKGMHKGMDFYFMEFPTGRP